jgi:hypothetical protein
VEYLFGLDTYVSVIMKFDRKSENGKGKMHWCSVHYHFTFILNIA